MSGVNSAAGFGPILFAERLEGPDRPTVLTYLHGKANWGAAENSSAPTI